MEGCIRATVRGSSVDSRGNKGGGHTLLGKQCGGGKASGACTCNDDFVVRHLACCQGSFHHAFACREFLVEGAEVGRRVRAT